MTSASRVERDNDSYLIRYERDENKGVISAAVIRDEKVRDSHKLRKEIRTASNMPCISCW